MTRAALVVLALLVAACGGRGPGGPVGVPSEDVRIPPRVDDGTLDRDVECCACAVREQTCSDDGAICSSDLPFRCWFACSVCHSEQGSTLGMGSEKYLSDAERALVEDCRECPPPVAP